MNLPTGWRVYSATLDSFAYHEGAAIKAGLKGKCTPHNYPSFPLACGARDYLNKMLKDNGHFHRFAVIEMS